jgi:hypothetical protein
MTVFFIPEAKACHLKNQKQDVTQDDKKWL